MKLFDLLFSSRPDLASTGWTHTETVPNLVGGHDVLGPSASVVATAFPNLLGGVTLGGGGHSAENAMGGHDYFAADGAHLGTTRPNLLGGEDLIGPTGSVEMTTGLNGLGGETLFVGGLPAFDSSPNLFGGVSLGDNPAFGSGFPEGVGEGAGMLAAPFVFEPADLGAFEFDAGEFDFGGDLGTFDFEMPDVDLDMDLDFDF